MVCVAPCIIFFQLSYLNVLPYCIHNHWPGLCVNTHETSQPGFQFVLRWLMTGYKNKDKQYVYKTNTDWFGFGLEIIHEMNQQYESVIAFSYNVAELQFTVGNWTISD